MPLRFDTGTTKRARKTATGGLLVPSYITRTGVFTYRRSDGTIQREYRSPEEVFSTDTLDSVTAAPLTVEHPPELIDTVNYNTYSAGGVQGSARADGQFVAADLALQTKAALDAYEAGKRELSCGYSCDVDMTPGVLSSGERYDAIQRNIRYNHVALVDKGRAGPEVRIRLDNADAILTDSGQAMEKIRMYEIDGIKFDSAEAAIEYLKSKRADAQKRADAAESKVGELEVKAKNAEKKADSANDQSRLDALVEKRMLVLDGARAVMGDQAPASGSDYEIMVAAVKADGYTVDDNASEAYVSGLFTAAVKQAKSVKSDSTAGVVSATKHDAASDVDAAYKEMLKNLRGEK